jgi:hypothetical protein
MGHYGIVYVIRNDKHPPNVFKVGGSGRDIENRLKELSGETSNVGEFIPKLIWPVNNFEEAEKLCHEALKPHLYEPEKPRKEFYQLPLKELWGIINTTLPSRLPGYYHAKVVEILQPKNHVYQAHTVYYDESGLAHFDQWPEKLTGKKEASKKQNGEF